VVAVLGYELYDRVYSVSNAPVVSTNENNTVPPGNPARPVRTFVPDYFTNTPDGPSIARRVVSQLNLEPDQVQVANAIIHANSREFSQIQSNYVAHTKDAAGHVHLTEKPLSEQDLAQVRSLRDQLWKELAGILRPEQLEKARRLPSDPFDTRLFPINTNQTTSLELWRDSRGEYHYVQDLESARSGETNLTSVSTNINIIPRAYQRYLNDD
jgi:hypothetical protein